MDNMHLFFIEDEFCFSLFNPKELVYLMVNLVSNFLSSLKAHYNQLSLLSGEQNLSEIIVLQCLLLDVSNIARHSCTSFFIFQIRSFCGRKTEQPELKTVTERITNQRGFFLDSTSPC